MGNAMKNTFTLKNATQSIFVATVMFAAAGAVHAQGSTAKKSDSSASSSGGYTYGKDAARDYASLSRVRLTYIWKGPISRLCKVTRVRFLQLWKRLIKRLLKVAGVIQLNRAGYGDGIQFFAGLQHLWNIIGIRGVLNTTHVLLDHEIKEAISRVIRCFG